MADLFLFGTLKHRPLLELVLGRPAPEGRAAALPGHRVAEAEGESFPVLVKAEGGAAEGLLLEGLIDADLARLDFYESGFGYGPVVQAVETGTGPIGARIYWPIGAGIAPGGPWDMARWIDEAAGTAMIAAEEVMGLFGQISGAELARRYGFIAARAWSSWLGVSRPAPATRRSPAGAAAPEVTDRPGGFHGFFRFRPITATHTRFDGARSEPVGREVFQGFDAALVLPYDPARDLVHLVEQFRYGPTLRRDPCARVFEPIAGMVDAGEDPAETARREAIEEAGLTLSDIRPIANVYASPGYSTDFFHCFLAVCDLTPDTSGRIGGHPGEDEDILSHVLPFEEAMALVDSDEINVGPLAMMLLWLCRARPGLRSEAARD